MDCPPFGAVRTTANWTMREDETPRRTASGSPEAARTEGNLPAQKAPGPPPTWTTLEDDVRRKVLDHLDLIECSHMAVSSKDGRALVDSLASPRAVLTGVPTVRAAQDMLAARVPQGAASKVLAAPIQPAERIVMRPLALVQANLSGWPDLRQVLRSEHGSAEAVQTLLFRALHLCAVERTATKVLGARFITRTDALRRRAYQRRDFPFFGSTARKRACAIAALAGGTITMGAAQCAVIFYHNLWAGACGLAAYAIAYPGIFVGGRYFLHAVEEVEPCADSWMTEAVGARDVHSKAHFAMRLELIEVSRGLKDHLKKLDKLLADAILRRIDHLILDNTRIGQCPGGAGSNSHWHRVCKVYANKLNEVSACLEALHQFSAAKVQPMFAWLRHLRVLDSFQPNGDQNYLRQEKTLAADWQDELPARLTYVSDAVALLRLQFGMMSSGDSGEDRHGADAVDARLQTARDAWVAMVTSLRAEAFILPAAAAAEAADQ